jgi:hypothetical protein
LNLILDTVLRSKSNFASKKELNIAKINVGGGKKG